MLVFLAASLAGNPGGRENPPFLDLMENSFGADGVNQELCFPYVCVHFRAIYSWRENVPENCQMFFRQ